LNTPPGVMTGLAAGWNPSVNHGLSLPSLQGMDYPIDLKNYVSVFDHIV
jgi:hypothetical protein